MSGRGARLGIIGCGIMGERILRTVIDNPDLGVELAGVYEPSDARRAELSESFPDIEWPDLPVDLIGASHCIYVATPPTTHLSYARQALGAGRALFTEKPLAVSLEEAFAFAGLVRETDARAAVNFIFASSPAVAQLEAWIAEGRVGDFQSLGVKAAFARWPRGWQMDASTWLDGRVEGGFTREVVSHLLFLTRRLLGPMRGLKASVTYPDNDRSETAISASMTAGDIPVTIEGSVGRTSEEDHNLWQLQGTAGSIRLRDWSTAEILNGDGKSWQTAPNALPHTEMRPILLRGQVAKLVALTRGEDQNLATIEEALDVQTVVENILAS